MPERLTVTVLLTVYNDRRARRVVESVLAGDRAPDEVLVADGGSTDGTWEDAVALQEAHPGVVRALAAPGSVAETRNQALPEVKGEVVAFIDADELAPSHWLGALVAPIEAGEADFTGGPTRPLEPAGSRAEAYLNAFDAWFYEHVVPEDMASLPMGNSAWRTGLLREVGGFDPRLTWGGEDWDVNLRAVRAGARGAFVPEAWLHHDQSNLDSFWKLARRKYRYSKGATVAYLKNGKLRERLGGAVNASVAFRHPYEWAFMAVKGLALAAGWAEWRRMRGGSPEA